MNLIAQEEKVNLEQRQMWENFENENKSTLQIVWDENQNSFSKLIGKTSNSYGSTPDEAINNFISQHSELLGIREKEHKLVVTKKNTWNSEIKNTHRYVVSQTYNQIPVLYSGYQINVTDDGFIEYISGSFYSEINISTNLESRINDALGVIYSDLNGTEISAIESEPELYILPLYNDNKVEFKLVYRTDVTNNDGTWRYDIDATNSNIVQKKNLLKRHNHPVPVSENSKININSKKYPFEKNNTITSSTSVTATGNVYAVSPDYANRTMKTLYRLDNASPLKLKGTNINVTTENGSDAFTTNGVFDFFPSSDFFDQTMVYYHGDTFENWLITNHGLPSGQVGKVNAYVRNGAGPGAVASTREMYFNGVGNGLLNNTYEASIIVHEYMHIVTGSFNNMTNPYNDEPLAMDEAFSDYFGIVYRNTTEGYVTGTESIIGKYVDNSNDNLIKYRDLDNSWTFDDYVTIELGDNNEIDEHDRSVIYSGALWILRNDPDVNPTVVDQLILESIDNLDPTPGFLDGMYALIATVTGTVYSNYEDDIKDAFITKKIYFDPPAVPTNFTLTNPTGSFPSFSWSSSSGSVSYKIFRKCSYGYYGDCSSIYEEVGSTSGTSWTDFSVTQNGSGQEDNYIYAVKGINSIGGSSNYSNSAHVGGQPSFMKELTQLLPETFSLKHNYPNPFNPSTQINFDLPETAEVSLKIYNIMGQEVTTLINKEMTAGFHSALFEADNLSSGVYIARLTAIGSSGQQFIQEIKMQLIK